MSHVRSIRGGACLLLAAALAGCGVLPSFGFGKKSPEAAESANASLKVTQVRADLNALKADPELGARVPAAVNEAESAVKEAEGAGDKARAHWVYIADRKVQTARALAEARRAEDRTAALRGPQP